MMLLILLWLHGQYFRVNAAPQHVWECDCYHDVEMEIQEFSFQRIS
jgi:NADH:ubiquinone oxidoreductase subunit 2 (subunit N)